MLDLNRKEINFIGYRKVFLSISCVLVVLSLCFIAFKGLDFGTEFTGGSTITFLGQEQMSSADDAGSATELTEASVRDALNSAGYNGELVIQTVQSGNSTGFLAQLSTTDVQECESYAVAAAETLGISTDDVQVSTIGPNWGANVVRTSAIAFAISILAIIAYIWIRFKDYKMGVTAIIALLHDIIIVVGIYALAGREVTPNAIAALLTIMGYSLYDTIVVFHRINDNVTSGAVKHSFWTIANHSINQTLTRTINTTLTSLVPVLAMLFFGGATLQDFAFAMSVGLICGSYSSIAVASPIYAIWKKREKGIEALEERYGTSVITDTRVVLAGLPVKAS